MRLAQELVDEPVHSVVILTRGLVVPVERHRPGEGGPPPGVRGLDARLWRASTYRMQSAKALAAAVGVKDLKEVYRALRRLVEAGLLRHVGTGFGRVRE